MAEFFTKRASSAAIRAEAAGLIELAGAARAGGVPVVPLLRVGDTPVAAGWDGRLEPGATTLTTLRLRELAPTRSAAEEFGRALARTHAHCPSGQRVFGQAPAGLVNDDGSLAPAFMGAERLPVVAPGNTPRRFGEFYAEDRLLPYLAAARANGSIGPSDARIIEGLCARLTSGALDHHQPALVTADAALIHGDLWSGNIMWTSKAATGAEHSSGASAEHRKDEPSPSPGKDAVVGVLIDPACHGGHAESDLAQLTVFGAPHVERIYAAYNEASPLADGWRERIGLHRLHILIVHAAIFGGGYGSQTVSEARRYL